MQMPDEEISQIGPEPQEPEPGPEPPEDPPEPDDYPGEEYPGDGSAVDTNAAGWAESGGDNA
jgi:hypothetical protein